MKFERRRDNSNFYPLSLSKPTYTTSGSEISFPPCPLMAGNTQYYTIGYTEVICLHKDKRLFLQKIGQIPNTNYTTTNWTNS